VVRGFRELVHAHEQPPHEPFCGNVSSNVLSLVNLYGKYTRAMTFENKCQAGRIGTPRTPILLALSLCRIARGIDRRCCACVRGCVAGDAWVRARACAPHAAGMCIATTACPRKHTRWRRLCVCVCVCARARARLCVFVCVW